MNSILDLCMTGGLTFLLTVLFILILCPFAIRIGLVDRPDARKLHHGEIPLIGGLAISSGVIVGQGLLGGPSFPYLVAAMLIVTVGLADDYRNVSIKWRLAAETLAALIMIEWQGVEIMSLGNLIGFGQVQLGELSTAFTVIAIVGGTNAFNMIDGIDGLVGSLSAVVFIFLLGLGILFFDAQLLGLCVGFLAATVAFLLFNLRLSGRKRAEIFLGDAGSTLLGFTISCLLISVTQGEASPLAPVTVLWLIAVPLFDAVSITIRRLSKKKSPFAADREHFHHIALAMGLTVNQTVTIILLASISLALVGVACDLLVNVSEASVFFVFLGLFTLYHAWMCSRFVARMGVERSGTFGTAEFHSSEVDGFDPNSGIRENNPG